MKINITNKQYEMMMKLLRLGRMSGNGCITEFDEDEKYMDEVFDYFLSFCDNYGHKVWMVHKPDYVGETQAFEMQEDMNNRFTRSQDEAFTSEFLDFATQSIFSQHPLVQKGGIADSDRSRLYDDVGAKVYDEYNTSGLKNFEVVIRK